MKHPGLKCLKTAVACGISLKTKQMTHMRSNKNPRNAYANQRKSAVELLEATKREYVKSTVVLNHRQELKHPENLSIGNREILSLPIFAKRLPPSEETNDIDKERRRSRQISGDESNKQISMFADNFDSRWPLTSLDNNRSTARLGDRQDSSRSGPTISSSEILHRSVNSCQVSIGSPATVSKENPAPFSVLSSLETSSSISKMLPGPVLVESVVSVQSDVVVVNRQLMTLASDLTTSASASDFHNKTAFLTLSANFDSSNHAFKPLLEPLSSHEEHVYADTDIKGRDLSKSKAPPPKAANKPAVAPKPGSASKSGLPPKLLKPDTHNTAEMPQAPPRSFHKRDNPPICSISSEKESVRPESVFSKQLSASSCNQSSNRPDDKRFSLMLANATDEFSKNVDNQTQVHVCDSRCSLHSQLDISTPNCATILSGSAGVWVDQTKSQLPIPTEEKELKKVTLLPRHHLHRSQSDLSNCRHSRTSSDYSDLSSKISRTSTEIERFFNEMGIDHSVLDPMRKLSDTYRKEIFLSLSSFGSLDGQSLSSQISNDLECVRAGSEQDSSSRDAGTTSVVERNARIIKWLCNVKKARTGQTKSAYKKTVS